MLFVAPRLGGAGPLFAPVLAAPLELRHLKAERVGDDVVLSAYVHEP